MNSLDFQLFQNGSTGQIVDVYNPQRATLDYVLTQVEARMGCRVAYITNDKNEVFLIDRAAPADEFFRIRKLSCFRPIGFEPIKKLAVTLVDSTLGLKEIESYVGESIKDLKARASLVFCKSIGMLTFHQRFLRDDEIVTRNCNIFEVYNPEFVKLTSAFDTPVFLSLGIKFKGELRRFELDLEGKVSDLFAKIYERWPEESSVFLTYKGSELLDFDQKVADFYTDAGSCIEVHSLDTVCAEQALSTEKTIYVNVGLDQSQIGGLDSSTTIGELKLIVMQLQHIDPNEFDLVFVYNGERLTNEDTLDKISDSDPLIHGVKRKFRS
jgi:hypothetical protein